MNQEALDNGEGLNGEGEDMDFNTLGPMPPQLENPGKIEAARGNLGSANTDDELQMDSNSHETPICDQRSKNLPSAKIQEFSTSKWDKEQLNPT